MSLARCRRWWQQESSGAGRKRLGLSRPRVPQSPCLALSLPLREESASGLRRNACILWPSSTALQRLTRRGPCCSSWIVCCGATAQKNGRERAETRARPSVGTMWATTDGRVWESPCCAISITGPSPLPLPPLRSLCLLLPRRFVCESSSVSVEKVPPPCRRSSSHITTLSSCPGCPAPTTPKAAKQRAQTIIVEKSSSHPAQHPIADSRRTEQREHRGKENGNGVVVVPTPHGRRGEPEERGVVWWGRHRGCEHDIRVG